MVTECETLSVPEMVQPGVPGTVAPEKLTVLGDPFVQPTVVAPLQFQGGEKPIQIIAEDVLVGKTIQKAYRWR
ncbi:hypothetical protein [Caulobacter endophyticus]|uniref:Uncharacterized protein n=1 Tax=Caulobacter endophyticus TaxID=2172652 RepID=A0A2T9K7P6_9CAUL|nr:hypothetical protein [Caulobacter endophyticus]PVM92002.1 hypothetical protein DDF67_05785 [Caulobacter endophyticus]